MNLDRESSIGFFDSGVGGLSVLKETMKILPNENFIYFGDSINAPYGTKTVEEVKKLAFKAVEFLLNKNVKAIVVACNTATSAAIEELRNTYSSIPIIGIEPAVKPAVKLKRHGSIVIMATPMTLVEKKFVNLQNQFRKEADIVALPCGGLAELIETGNIDGENIKKYLEDKLQEVSNLNISAVVLGCTHYPFVKNQISNIIGQDIPIIDGSEGTAKQLKRMLLLKSINNNNSEKGTVTIYNSLNNKEVIDLSYKLLYL